ncbi:uncharacterized protein LOC134277637, partial [Saccostrea cucullata]|uniref:uncharacterized protein LOC134277637 n=1 Tax=Saccostrea cuccullata TaxID=36930 RepID=UPI002ED604D1
PLRRFYKKSGSSVPFFNLSKSVVNAFSDKVANLKQILLGLGDIEANSIKAAKSSEECIELIKENNLFNPRDVIYMQYLLKEAGCNEVYEKCIEYAIKAKAMCFYENPQENGFIQVKFHICVNLQEYNEQEIACIKKTVEDILECREDEIKIAGLCNAKGFILILSIKEKYAKDLTSLNQHQCEKLKKLNVDYIIVGERKIDMESQKSSFMKKTNEITINKDKQTPGRTARFSLKAAAIKRYYRDELAVPAIVDLIKEWINSFAEKQDLTQDHDVLADLQSLQEEADGRLVLQAAHAARQGYSAT